MTREMKNSGIEWIGEIPADWRVENLQWNMTEIIEKNSPIKMTSVLSLTKEKGVIPYEDKGNQGNKSKESIEEYKIAYKDTIVANSMNILIGSVGISNYDGCVSPVYYVFKNNEKTDLRYLNYIFTTEQFQKQLRKYANGILEIRLRVSSENIMKQKVMFPTLTEQKKISDFLDSKVSEIDKMITETKSSIENYKEYKQSVITEAVTKGLNKNVQMKDSGYEHIGNVPFNWRIGKIKNIFDFVGGFAFQSDKFVGETDYQVLRIGNVKNDKILFSANPVYINEDYIQPRYEVKKDYILFTMTGTRHKKDYFYTVCVDEKMLEVKKMYINQRVGAFSPKVEMVAKYFSYLFKTEHILDNIFLYETGTANQGNLGIESISNTVIQIPPIEEQEKITAHLDSICIEIDNLISEKEALIANLEEYKKSLIYEYVTGKKLVL